MKLISPHKYGANFDESRNQRLADFLNELRPQSIGSFKPPNFDFLGPEFFQALNCHGESLTELKLVMSPIRLKIVIPVADLFFSNLSLRKDCTNLVSLSLDGELLWDTKFKESRHDGFRKTCAWLK